VLLALLLVMMVVDLGWASAAQWARGWLKSPRAMRISNRFAATAMGGAAVAIATR
jgi:threonine/homoserine/homoserine lactone efflux protein